MDQLQEVVASGKGGFESLIEKIPGIKGYKAKEDRRSTDKLVRETVAARLEEEWARISALQRQLLKAGALGPMGDLESPALKIRQFIDRIRTAAYGYAGLMDAVKVDEAALNQLYDYDLYLFSLVDEVRKRLDTIEAGIGGPETELNRAIQELTKVAAEMVTAFNRRSEVVQGTVNS